MEEYMVRVRAYERDIKDEVVSLKYGNNENMCTYVIRTLDCYKTYTLLFQYIDQVTFTDESPCLAVLDCFVTITCVLIGRKTCFLDNKKNTFTKSHTL